MPIAQFLLTWDDEVGFEVGTAELALPLPCPTWLFPGLTVGDDSLTPCWDERVLRIKFALRRHMAKKLLAMKGID